MTPKSPNTISSDVEIKGTIKFENDLVADGRIEGEIITKGALVIGTNGYVQGDITAGSVAIQGQVLGNVTADQRVELLRDSELVGDLTSPRVMIDDGATFVGKANINPSTIPMSSAASAPAPAQPKTAEKK